MRKVKFVSVFMLLMLLSASPQLVMAMETAPGECPEAKTGALPPQEEMARLVAEDEKAKYEGIAMSFTVFDDGTIEPNVSTRGVCVRTPFGPGKVNWEFASPGQGGAGYSVKPESGSYLIWASPPSQGIDGIYRSSWGAVRRSRCPTVVLWTSIRPPRTVHAAMRPCTLRDIA
jgi:hypothetical protein